MLTLMKNYILILFTLSFFTNLSICQEEENQTCYPPWSGKNCEILNIQSTFEGAGVEYETSSTWGGSAIYGDDGKYHIFYSKFTNHCGLVSWERNSECVHGVSDTPMGPFEEVEVLNHPWCHNPTIIRAPDGTFVFYTTDSGDHYSKEMTDCEDGYTLESPGPIVAQVYGCFIKMRSSKSVWGPWSEEKIINNPLTWQGICQNNPAPIVQPDGEILFIYRASVVEWTTLIFQKKYIYHSKLFIAKAKSWDSEYAPVPGKEKAINKIDCEDPNGWYDQRTGLFHMLYNNYENSIWSGGHAISKDGFEWDFIDPVYSKYVNYQDGKEEFNYRRERPQMMWLSEEKGVLFNGVEHLQFEVGYDKTHTLAVPVGGSLDEIQNFQQE